MNKLLNTNKAFSLVEVIVAAAIVLLIGVAFTGSLSKTISLSNRALRTAQSTALLEEGAEAVKTIRDNNWATIAGLTVGTTYYLSYNTTTDIWSLTTTPSVIDNIFTRTIVLSSVNRNATDDIAVSGTLDPKTKLVTVTTTFTSDGMTVTKSLPFYISDIFN